MVNVELFDKNNRQDSTEAIKKRILISPLRMNVFGLGAVYVKTNFDLWQQFQLALAMIELYPHCKSERSVLALKMGPFR